ncbi:MAG: hypothetical protein CVV49_05300 [Spirochaetae bacterium HGW-Spirochaetae-5]|nr:MAG: hypothetical protein CVV49_05300 [Spirochaetae bacterium HGW-Spirochaetae-5]
MNVRKIFTALILIYTLPLFSVIQPGGKSPYFQVSDGKGRVLYSTDLTGKAVIGFYETRDTGDKNNALKDELNSFRRGTKKSIKDDTFRLAVVDSSEANVATAWIWRKNMVKRSAELGINIYGDWDGKMKRDFAFPDNESVFIIIDKKNVVRYIYAGRVPESEFAGIKNIIKKSLED